MEEHGDGCRLWYVGWVRGRVMMEVLASDGDMSGALEI